MTYPPDEHMVILLALHPAACESIVIDGDQPRLAGIGVPVKLEIVDALVDRGWAEHVESGPVVTERGAYWLKRWMDKHMPKGSRFKRLAVAY